MAEEGGGHVGLIKNLHLHSLHIRRLRRHLHFKLDCSLNIRIGSLVVGLRLNIINRLSLRTRQQRLQIEFHKRPVHGQHAIRNQIAEAQRNNFDFVILDFKIGHHDLRMEAIELDLIEGHLELRVQPYHLERAQDRRARLLVPIVIVV